MGCHVRFLRIHWALARMECQNTSRSLHTDNGPSCAIIVSSERLVKTETTESTETFETKTSPPASWSYAGRLNTKRIDPR